MVKVTTPMLSTAPPNRECTVTPGISLNPARNVSVRNLMVRNGQDSGIDVEAPSVTLSGITFSGQEVAGVYIGVSSAYSTVVTLNFSPIDRKSSVLPRNENADARAATNGDT